MFWRKKGDNKQFEKLRDKVYKEYKNSINMTHAQLKRWSENPLSKKASLTRGPIKRNLRLLSKPKSSWNRKDLRDAKKTISFNSRMKGVKKGNPVSKETTLSKRDISLRNWAFNPNKKAPF